MALENEINDVILYPLVARTAAPTVNAQTNKFAKGMVFTVNVTVIGSAPSIVFNLEGYDPASGTWYVILASAAVVAVGTTTYYVFPGSTVTTNVSANKSIPRQWRIRPVHANTDTISYSVGVSI